MYSELAKKAPMAGTMAVVSTSEIPYPSDIPSEFIISGRELTNEARGFAARLLPKRAHRRA